MLFSNLLKRVETGVPGVKPPEPVIAVVEHQCLTQGSESTVCLPMIQDSH